MRASSPPDRTHHEVDQQTASGELSDEIDRDALSATTTESRDEDGEAGRSSQS
jgi:hypothetical protein